MPTIEFTGDDEPALDYIRKRGYASYSSIKNVRDKIVPQKITKDYFTFGKELHSRLLESQKLEKLSKVEEQKLKEMLEVLRANAIVKRLLDGAKCEDKFHQELYGVMVLGYIDIHNTDIADLKTTHHNKLSNFAADMDFLQAAMYLAVTGKKNFYYVGICKAPPYNLMIFNVQQYPDRIKAAHTELKTLLKYIKSKL
jgi:hypothetical protein